MNTLEALLKEVRERVPANTIVGVEGSVLRVNPTHRNALFRELRTSGYGIRKAPRGCGGGWWVNLRTDVCTHKGKCGYCEALIDPFGIFVHGRHCEACGKLICEEYVDGGHIEFFFANDPMGPRNRITMVIKYFDQCVKNKNAGELVLYAEPVNGRHGFSNHAPRAKEILTEHKHQFHRFSEGGLDYIGILYERGMIRVIHTTDHSEGWKKASTVNVYKGKEYRDIVDPLPIPQTFTIYEANT